MNDFLQQYQMFVWAYLVPYSVPAVLLIWVGVPRFLVFMLWLFLIWLAVLPTRVKDESRE